MPTGIFISGYGEDKKEISLMKRITNRTASMQFQAKYKEFFKRKKKNVKKGGSSSHLM